LRCGVISIGVVCAGQVTGVVFECIVRCAVFVCVAAIAFGVIVEDLFCFLLENQVVRVMVACSGGALRLLFWYVVLYGSLSTTFGEDAEGIIANSWRKGNIIIIWYQRVGNQCDQAGSGSPSLVLHGCRIQYQGSFWVCAPKSTHNLTT